ncbi:Hypothetical predicted protein [Paramuricea clavata]|uniref:Uncharacterized protein n=1 Tax=Paramuricea clavata TaxID=317549 RepID=A0A6S7HJ98_PARCT|nr:Hypothetical predicted protein [Paramuricea clavata]
MSTYDLHDAWRTIHPNAQEYSWHRPNGRQASRIDMIWLSALLLSCVKRVNILSFFRSDHSTVYLELCLLSATHHGDGVWKLNTRHLSDESFVKLVSDFGQKKAVSRRKLITLLEHTLFHFNGRLLNGDEVLPIIEDVKSELEPAHRDEAGEARIHANVQWAEEEEASIPSIFVGLERKRGQHRIFTSVKIMAGTVVSTFVGIARAWVAFYGLPFTSQSLDRIEQDFFLNSLSLKLSRAEQSLCEGD